MVERGADPTMIINLAHELQKRIGLQPIVKVDAYNLPNESGTIYRILRIQPGSLSEISRVIRAARTMKLHIRVIGKGMSLNKVILMNDFSVVLDLRYLVDTPRIERVTVKMKDLSYVEGLRVLAGVTIAEFSEYQVRNQVMVPTSIDSIEHTVVGSIVDAASASVTNALGTLADYVIQARILDIHGEIRTYTDNSTIEFNDSPNLIKSIISGVGMLGVVYDVVLKFTPLINVRVNYEYLKIDYLFNNLSVLTDKINENVMTQIIYLPFNSSKCKDGSTDIEDWTYSNDEIMVRTMSEVDIDSERRMFINLIDETKGHVEVVLKEPRLIPDIMRQNNIQLRRTYLKPYIQYLPWAINCFNELSSGTHEIGITVSYEKDFLKTFQIVLDKIQHFAKVDRNYAVNAGMRVNFTRASGVTLAPGCTSDLKSQMTTVLAHIKIFSVLCSEGWPAVSYHIMDEVLRQIPRATLQWNTEWIDKPVVTERILELNDTKLPMLKQQIEIMDRDGVFLNYHIQRMFYPVLESYRRTYKKEQDEYLSTLH